MWKKISRIMSYHCLPYKPDTKYPCTLAETLQSILQHNTLSGASTGIVVQDASSGRIVYSKDAHRRLIPASCMKLFTSLAAFSLLGANYRFETRLLTTAEQCGDVLHGDIYLQGSGDPTLHPDDLHAFAECLAQKGIRRIHGRLITDSQAFDDSEYGTGWTLDDEPLPFAAPVSALNYSFNESGDINVIRIDIRPGANAGEPGQVTFYPENDRVSLINKTITGDITALSLARKPGSNLVTVTGTIAASMEMDSHLITVDSPATVVGALLQKSLRLHGIVLNSDPCEGPTPCHARILTRKVSAPLSLLMTTFLKLSNNSYGEILTKAMGRMRQGKGNWHDGLLAISRFVQKLGINAEEFIQVDGSGLSRMNMVAPEHLTTLLLAARYQPWFTLWHNALPVAGMSEMMTGGTLHNRMTGTIAQGRVYAKTGSMTGVSSLSGYVYSAAGRLLVFSVMSNGLVVPDEDIKALEDRIVVALAKYT